MTIWRMRIACWIPKVTDTHTLRVRNTYCFSTAATVKRTRLKFTFKRTPPVRYVAMPFRLLEITTDYAHKLAKSECCRDGRQCDIKKKRGTISSQNHFKLICRVTGQATIRIFTFFAQKIKQKISCVEQISSIIF